MFTNPSFGVLGGAVVRPTGKSMLRLRLLQRLGLLTPLVEFHRRVSVPPETATTRAGDPVTPARRPVVE